MKLIKHTTLSSSNASGPTLLSDHATVYYMLNDVLNWLCRVYIKYSFSSCACIHNGIYSQFELLCHCKLTETLWEEWLLWNIECIVLLEVLKSLVTSDPECQTSASHKAPCGRWRNYASVSLLKRCYEITGQCEFGLGLTACRSARPETFEMEGSGCYFTIHLPCLWLNLIWRKTWVCLVQLCRSYSCRTLGEDLGIEGSVATSPIFPAELW